MAGKKILLVEDEYNVGSTLMEFLAHSGYEAIWATTAKEAIAQFQFLHFDLILMDVGLPDGSGFDLAKQAKTFLSGVSIIFLTACGETEDRIHGLELGAEDYIVKPYSMKELALRIKNCLKNRNYRAPEEKAIIGQAQFHFDQFQVNVAGTIQNLGTKECALMQLLYERKNMVVSRDVILNLVWSEEEFPNERTVDNFIVKLRKLVEQDPRHPQIVKSIRGVGYKLEL